MAEPLGKPAARLCPSCGVGGEVASIDSIQWLPSKNESYILLGTQISILNLPVFKCYQSPKLKQNCESSRQHITEG